MSLEKNCVILGPDLSRIGAPRLSPRCRNATLGMACRNDGPFFLTPEPWKKGPLLWDQREGCEWKAWKLENLYEKACNVCMHISYAYNYAYYT